jgi:hypothetical protein
MSAIISDATRAAMALFTRLLANDADRQLQEIATRSAVVAAPEVPDPDKDWISQYADIQVAHRVLRDCEQLDVGPSEAHDVAIEQLRMAPGEEWLRVVESGWLNGTDYVGHVLHFLGEGGYPGPMHVQDVLHAAKVAPNEAFRDALAVALPEYIGLYRGATDVTGGVARLLPFVGK